MLPGMSRKSGILKYTILLTLFIPPNKHFVSQKTLKLIVEQEELKIYPSEVLVDSFGAGKLKHLVIELDTGKNRIILKNKKMDTLVYEYYPHRSFKHEYPEYRFHIQKNKVCTECHEIELKKVENKEDLSCFTCHKEKFDENLNMHPPFEELDCMSCHKKKMEVKQNICEDCHDVSKSFRTHAPYVRKECTICHDPHSSKQDFLLKKVLKSCVSIVTSHPFMKDTILLQDIQVKNKAYSVTIAIIPMVLTMISF